MKIFNKQISICAFVFVLYSCVTLDSASQNISIGMSKNKFCTETGLVSLQEDPCFGTTVSHKDANITIMTNSIKSSYYLFHYDKLTAITLTEKSALLKADEISELNIEVFVPNTEIPDA